MQEIISLINGNLVRIITKKIVQEIIKRVAFLGWGPLGWILSTIVEKIVEKALYHGQLLVTDQIINRVIHNDVEAVDDLTDKLIEVDQNVENYTEEELNELDEELMDAYRNLLTF